jgi:release factor glutamine methyltransferase
MTFSVPRSRVDEIVRTLRAAGCVFAEDEAALLVAQATTSADLQRMVERRVAGAPLEVILGWAEFAGLRIQIDPGVFVPRRRTEFLANEATLLARSGSVVVDLCCGSGAVGVAILAAVPDVELYAADIEPAAVRCARRNLAGIGAVFRGDLYDALPVSLRTRVDVLVVNAPYVPTEAIEMMPPEARLHEPLAALDGGADGMDIQRRVAAAASEWLSPDGFLLIETSRRQAQQTARIFRRSGLDARTAHSEDLDGTVVIGKLARARQTTNPRT